MARVQAQNSMNQFGSNGFGGGGFAPQHQLQKKEEDKKKNEAEASYIDSCLNLFNSKGIEGRKELAEGEDARVEEQAQTMLKSIFAYWCVFSLRFVDNLH